MVEMLGEPVRITTCPGKMHGSDNSQKPVNERIGLMSATTVIEEMSAYVEFQQFSKGISVKVRAWPPDQAEAIFREMVSNVADLPGYEKPREGGEDSPGDVKRRAIAQRMAIANKRR